MWFNFETSEGSPYVTLASFPWEFPYPLSGFCLFGSLRHLSEWPCSVYGDRRLHQFVRSGAVYYRQFALICSVYSGIPSPAVVDWWPGLWFWFHLAVQHDIKFQILLTTCYIKIARENRDTIPNKMINFPPREDYATSFCLRTVEDWFNTYLAW